MRKEIKVKKSEVTRVKSERLRLKFATNHQGAKRSLAREFLVQCETFARLPRIESRNWKSKKIEVRKNVVAKTKKKEGLDCI